MFSKRPAALRDAAQTERRRMILNEKCKAQSAFLYNLGVAIITTGPVVNILQKSPIFDLPLLLISCAFAAFFYLMASNRLDQMVE